MAWKAYSKNKVIVGIATGLIKCGLGSPGKIYLSPGNLFLKKDTNPERLRSNQPQFSSLSLTVL